MDITTKFDTRGDGDTYQGVLIATGGKDGNINVVTADGMVVQRIEKAHRTVGKVS